MGLTAVERQEPVPPNNSYYLSRDSVGTWEGAWASFERPSYASGGMREIARDKSKGCETSFRLSINYYESLALFFSF